MPRFIYTVEIDFLYEEFHEEPEPDNLIVDPVKMLQAIIGDNSANVRGYLLHPLRTKIVTAPTNDFLDKYT